MSIDSWTWSTERGAWVYGPSLYKSRSIQDVEGSYFLRSLGYFQCNLDRPSKIQRSELLLPYSVGTNRGAGGVAPWPVVRELELALWCINP
jgi:hypothetical protein